MKIPDLLIAAPAVAPALRILHHDLIASITGREVAWLVAQVRCHSDTTVLSHALSVGASCRSLVMA